MSSSRILQNGTILNGKYMIDSVIGEGGFGITYKATDLTLEEIVAIKEYFPSSLATRDTTSGKSDEITIITGDSEAAFKNGVKKFEDEAANLAKFQKEQGIVSVKTFFHENNTGYMVMEYIDGITLKEYLEKHNGKVSVDEAKKIMGRILTSLSNVHKAGIVHRDISPDNIMITSDGQGKLIDFGAARFVGNEDEKNLTVILKEGYAPPEQYHSDGKQGPWTDIYAICATLYRMVCGVRPQSAPERMLSGGRSNKSAENSGDGEKLVPLSKRAGTDKSFSRVIEKGMSLDAGKRYQTVEKLMSDFNRKQMPSKYYVIAGGALAMMLLVGLVVIVVNLVGVKKNDTEIGAINRKEAETETEINDEEEKAFTEEELVASIEEKSGLAVVQKTFADFDSDGDNEVFALVQDSEKTKQGIWWADGEKNKWVYDIDIDMTIHSFDKMEILVFDDNTICLVTYSGTGIKDGIIHSCLLGADGEGAYLLYNGENRFGLSENRKLIASNVKYVWNPELDMSVPEYSEPVELFYQNRNIYQMGEISFRDQAGASKIYDKSAPLGAVDEYYPIPGVADVYYPIPDLWDDGMVMDEDGLYSECLDYFSGRVGNDIISVTMTSYDDYDDDGQLEGFICFKAYGYYMNYGCYYVDGNNILCIDEKINLEPQQLLEIYRIEELRFGKDKICAVQYSTVNYSNIQFFKINDDAIINMCITDNYLKIENDSIFCSNGNYSMKYDKETGACTEKDYWSGGLCCDWAKIWYVDNKFQECASIEITEEQLSSISGGREFLENYKKELGRYFDEKEILKEYDENDYDIQSILLCSDDNVYITCVPYRYFNKYWANGIDSYLDTFVLVHSLSDEIGLTFVEIYQGYRKPRITGFDPYYPDIDKFDFPTQKESGLSRDELIDKIEIEANGEISEALYDDYDGDGISELFAYLICPPTEGDYWNGRIELWYADNNSVRKIGEDFFYDYIDDFNPNEVSAVINTEMFQFGKQKVGRLGYYPHAIDNYESSWFFTKDKEGILINDSIPVGSLIIDHYVPSMQITGNSINYTDSSDYLGQYSIYYYYPMLYLDGKCGELISVQVDIDSFLGITNAEEIVSESKNQIIESSYLWNNLGNGGIWGDYLHYENLTLDEVLWNESGVFYLNYKVDGFFTDTWDALEKKEIHYAVPVGKTDDKIYYYNYDEYSEDISPEYLKGAYAYAVVTYDGKSVNLEETRWGKQLSDCPEIENIAESAINW